MSMTKADVDALNALVKAGRIEEARALLKSIGGSKAVAALARLNERFPEPAPVSIKPRPRIDRIVFFILLVVIVAMVAVYIAPSISQMNENARAINQAVESMR